MSAVMRPSSSAPLLGLSGGMRPSRSAGELVIGPLVSLGVRPPSASKLRGDQNGIQKYETSLQLKNRPQNHATLFFAQNKDVTLEFKHSSPHGLSWDGVIVKGATDQAKALGVQPGWKILMVDGEPVFTSEEIWANTQKAKWQWRSYKITFTTNIRAIRSEQALERANAMIKEAERLMKLPFAGTGDEKHVDQVREHFEFKGYIDKLEDRAISLVQLQDVMKWVKTKCHRWRDGATAEATRISGQKLSIETITMEHLYHWLIVPSTKPKDCSFVEMLTNQKQPPAFFVIFWCGMRVQDLLKCLDTHANVRQISHHTGFFIGSCADRPHKQRSDKVAANPRQTWAYRGMAAAKFHGLLCLDPLAPQVGSSAMKGPATPFTRLWCCYEWSILASVPDFVLDVAIMDDAKALTFTMGLTREEEEFEKASSGAGYKAKGEREKGMDLEHILERVWRLQVQNTQSKDPAERIALLNAIAGNPLDGPPSKEQEAYSRTNCMLIATIMLCLWRRVMSLASSDSDIQRLQMQMADAIKADQQRESLKVSLAFLPGDDKLSLLLRCFPTGLKHLSIDLRGMDLTPDNVHNLANAMPQDLEELHIDLRGNEQICNVHIEKFVALLPARLHAMNLNLEGCTNVAPEMQSKGKSLEGMRQYIWEEAQKGHTCTILNLLPSEKRRMIVETYKCKVFPDAK